MTGLVERLVDRTVRATPVTPTIRPRRRSRFERVGGPGRAPAPAGLVEQHVEVPAPVERRPPVERPAVGPVPERVPADGPARRSDRRIEASPAPVDRVVREPLDEPLTVSGSSDAPVDVVTSGPVERVVVPVPLPTEVAIDPPGSEREPASPPEPLVVPAISRVVEQQVVGVPVVERIVETEQVPIVVERPIEVATGHRRRPPERPVAATHERRVVVDGGEPLERRGLTRLDAREVITHPAVVDATERAAPDAPIHVHIGRLEVRRPAPPSPPPPPRARPPAPVLGLDQYLAERPTRRSAR